jgi:hypothetical protein
MIECDEGDHRSYACENKRTMQLFLDFGSRPLVLVRFNPDACFRFTDSNRIGPIPEYWDLQSQDILYHVRRHLSQLPSKEITIEKLFYPLPKV